MYSIVVMAALTTGGETPDFGRRGCSGGCYGCGGCYGGCYGGGGCCRSGGGGYARGGYGYGGGGSGYARACYGGYGGGYGCGGGCYGGSAYRSSYPMAPYTGSYSAPAMFGALAPTTPPPVQTASATNRATFVVNVPPDARLTVDDTPTRSTSSRRVFTSPPLEPGKTYSYTLKAEITRGGQTFSTSREVTVRPGRQTEVTLDIPTATASVRR